MKHILLLGHTGFIGSELHKRLKKNHIIQAVSSQECNLLDIQSIMDCLSSINSQTTVIFTSCIVRTKQNNLDSFESNIQMVSNFIRAISNKINQIIFLSTIDIYGLIPANTIITEKTPAEPKDSYALAKLTSEFLLKQSCESRNILLSILRLPGVYAEQEHVSILGKLYNNAIKGNITLYNKGLDTRDFLFIQDLVVVIEKCIEKSFNGLLNVVSGNAYSIHEIACKIQKKIPSSTIEYKTTPQYEKRQHELKFNNEKLQNLILPYTMTDSLQGIEYLQQRQMS